MKQSQDSRYAAQEQFLRKLKGIISVRVEGDRDIEHVSVVANADNGRHGEQVVHDVRSALKVRFDLDLDPSQVTVTMLLDGDRYALNPTRPVLQDVEVETDGTQTTVRVTIGRDQDDVTIEKTGLVSTQNRMRLAALATASAIEQQVFIKINARLILDAVQHVFLGQDLETCMVSLYLRLPETEMRLVGVGIIQGDPVVAAARATLDAVNRQIQLLEHH